MAEHTVYYTIEIQGQRTVEADTPAEARDDVHDELAYAIMDIEADSLRIKTQALTGISGLTFPSSLI